MMQYYGIQPPHRYSNLKIGAVCPHCEVLARFIPTGQPSFKAMYEEGHGEFVAAYACDACSRALAVRWSVEHWESAEVPIVDSAELIVRSVERFDYDHVPDSVRLEVEEALDCLSVNAFNGFAALCRRSVQAICTNLGAGASTRVQSQIKEMAQLTDLEDDWEDLTLQIMMTGHDGSHPHLPDVDQSRSAVLLSLLRDLTYQLYTRPGNVKAAAQLRLDAIAADKA